MPKLTLEDKRRETLRRQLYGKEVSIVRVKPVSNSLDKENNTKTFSFASQHTTSSLPTTYLAKDLTKVLIFSFLAIGIQLSLYFLLQHNLVKLPF